MSEDYYSILGVSKTASKSEIYKGYRKMAAKWHPDICKDKDVANTQMKKINAAYEILSNEEKKMQYDQFLNQGGNTQDFNEHQQGGYDYNNMEFDAKNLSDIFSSFFSSNNSSSTRFYYNSNEQASYFDSDYTDNTATAKGANKSIRIRMTLEEWYCGSKHKVEYDRKIECKSCKAIKRFCQYCNGAGVTKSFFITSVCNRCNGYGFHIMSSHCSKCKNRCIHSNTKFTLSIPQFTHNKIYVEDYGDFDGIQYGNLLVNIDLLDHQVYKIQGQNIQRNIKIGIDDFLTGAKINFKYLNNQQISVEIPKLNTKPIIIKGLGVSTKSKSGDLILYIKVENNIDPKKTTEQIINLLNCHSIEDNTYQKY